MPPAWAVGCGAVVLMGAHQLSSPGWGGVALNVAALVLAGGALLWWSGRPDWGPVHLLAVCGAALVVNAALSFVVEPLGDTSPVVKYGANGVLMIVVLLLLGWARRRLRFTAAPRPLEGARSA